MESTDFRKYSMTNSELAMFVSNLIQSMKRDETALNTKGITISTTLSPIRPARTFVLMYIRKS